MNNCDKNFGFRNKSGILMPVSSLPGQYGIGSFGKNAFQFIDFLDATGQTCWQVLPLNPTSYGDSPYQSPASVAGNPYFIDLELLAEDGLLTAEDLASEESTNEKVDYGRLFVNRYPLLRKAYGRFTPTVDFKTFCLENSNWLDDYALFMAFKVDYDYRPWTTWAQEHRDILKAREYAEEYDGECEFWKFVQFTFFKQWKAVKDYAHSKGIVIIGDMPIYVAHDSMDVWRAPEQFLLDEDYMPTVVAGCPPDAYSAVGQLWGNPIYNWALMAEEDFAWWIDRVKSSFVLYDLLRIDHFRGFASYYTIPAGEETAIKGHWEKGPGVALFDAIKKNFPEAKIIAEDLGFITDDVRELLEKTGFPGMKVLQFAFYDDYSEYLPANYMTDNCIVYTASHDSDCTRSWYANLDKKAVARFKKARPAHKGQRATEAAIEMAMTSRANLAVITMQDYLDLNNEQGRMNIPSVSMGNWRWRVKEHYDSQKLIDKVRRLTETGDRLKK